MHRLNSHVESGTWDLEGLNLKRIKSLFTMDTFLESQMQYCKGMFPKVSAQIIAISTGCLSGESPLGTLA